MSLLKCITQSCTVLLLHYFTVPSDASYTLQHTVLCNPFLQSCDCYKVYSVQYNCIVCRFLFLSLENKWSNFDVIYYEYGALVLVYNNTEKATQAFNLLQEATFDDKQKQLLVLLLPNIQVIHHQLLFLSSFQIKRIISR